MTLFMALCDLVKHLKLEADGDNVRDVGSRYVLMTLHELRETPPVAIRSTNEVVCLRIEMIGNRLAGDRQFALVLTRAPTYEPLQLRSVVRIERDAAGMDFVDGCPATAIAETTDVSTFRVVPEGLHPDCVVAVAAFSGSQFETATKVVYDPRSPDLCVTVQEFDAWLSRFGDCRVMVSSCDPDDPVLSSDWVPANTQSQVVAITRAMLYLARRSAELRA